MYCSQFWRPEVQCQGVGMATLALNAPEKDLFQVLLPSPGRLRGSLETRLSPLSPSLSLFILSSHSLSSCLLLSEFPPYKFTHHLGLGTTPMTSSLLHLQRPHFQVKPHLEVLGVKTSTCLSVGGGEGAEFNPQCSPFRSFLGGQLWWLQSTLCTAGETSVQRGSGAGCPNKVTESLEMPMTVSP